MKKTKKKMADLILFNKKKKKEGWGLSISTDEDALEGFTELEVENGVNDRIDERIDVAQPSGQLESRSARLTVAFEFRANGVHDVAREERHPTD